jgi:pimeloyl-ACP methyl ester carboxylesterase
MPDLAPLLEDQFRVVHYDRRGRGRTPNPTPYHPDREIEDILALVEELGGEVYLYGTSSGAVLAARAVAAGARTKGLVLHEPPLSLDKTHFPKPPDFREQIAALIARERPSEAAKLFLRVVGVPAFGVFFMRLMPSVWKPMTAAAHTLPHDFAILGDTQSGGPLPDELKAALAKISAPTCVLVGGKSPPYLHHAAKTVAQHIPGAELEVLPGQMHNAAAKAVAPVLKRKFVSSQEERAG